MKVRELLSDETKWTQGAFARNSAGKALRPEASRAASSWCLVGAINRCYEPPEDYRVQEEVWQSIGSDIVPWNDARKRTFAQVKALVDELDI